MSKADLVLILIAAIGAWGGYRQGFLMEILSLGAIVLGIFLGFKLMGEGMIFLEERFNADRSTLPYISFIVIFIIVILAVRLLGNVVKSSMDKTFLGTVDQAFGAGLGAFRTLFLVSVILWILDSLKLSPRAEWVDGSWLYPFTARLAPVVADWLGQFIPLFREIFREF
ncbi:MAG: CvpA family protein [Cytophagales bacterium]|nr:CvpA family protein [Cytophagales bacterium]